jgi:ABC-type sugar transport system substrate-binding protein
MQLIEDMITKGVAGIAVRHQHRRAGGRHQESQRRRHPVVMFNSITELSGCECTPTPDTTSTTAGKIADWVNEKTGGKANVAIIEGLPSDYTTSAWRLRR